MGKAPSNENGPKGGGVKMGTSLVSSLENDGGKDGPKGGNGVAGGGPKSQMRPSDAEMTRAAQARLQQRFGAAASRLQVTTTNGVVNVRPMQGSTLRGAEVGAALNGMSGMQRLDNRVP